MLRRYTAPAVEFPPPAIVPIWQGTRPSIPPPTGRIQTWCVRVAAKPIGLTWDELAMRIEQKMIGAFA